MKASGTLSMETVIKSFFSQVDNALGTMQILVIDEPVRVDQRCLGQVTEMYKKNKMAEYSHGMMPKVAQSPF